MGLLHPADWRGQWIGGRTNLDHDWTDQTLTVDFTLEAKTLEVLFHAQPIGKTYGESRRLSASRRTATRRPWSGTSPPLIWAGTNSATA